MGPRLSLMLLEVGDTGMLNTKNFLPLSNSRQLMLCGEALKQSGNMQQSLAWLPSNMTLMSYGYTVSRPYGIVWGCGERSLCVLGSKGICYRLRLYRSLTFPGYL